MRWVRALLLVIGCCIVAGLRCAPAWYVNVDNLDAMRRSLNSGLARLYWASGWRSVENLNVETRIVFDERLADQMICRNLENFRYSDHDLKRPAEYSRRSPVAVNAMGRYLVCNGRFDEAIRLIGSHPPSPMLYGTLGSAYLGLGDAESAFRAYQQAECLGAGEWCAGYLVQHALEMIEQENLSDALRLLHQARHFRPLDMAANYFLWLYSPSSNERLRCLAALLRPLPASLSVRDATLQRELVALFPELVKQGLWDQAVAGRFAALLVWYWPQAEYVGDIVNGMTMTFPEYSGWAKLSDELYRRGSQSSQVTTVESCSAVAPDDTGDLDWAARQLGTTSDRVVPGVNLFATPPTRQSQWHVLNMAEGQFWDRALYVLGVDPLWTSSGYRCTLRIDGLWSQGLPGRQGSWAGFQQWDTVTNLPRRIQLDSNTLYLLAWSYRTDRLSGTPNVWLGPRAEQGLQLKANNSLDGTSGRWRRIRILFVSGAGQSQIELAVRLFEQGTVWFADIKLVPLKVENGQVILLQQPVMEVEDQ